MRVPYYRQYWTLRRVDRGLCRSDRHLAAMLAIFTRLYAGEPIASAEQARRVGVLAALTWLVSTMTRLAGRLIAAVGRVIGRAAVGCAALRRRVRGDRRRNAPVG